MSNFIRRLFGQRGTGAADAPGAANPPGAGGLHTLLEPAHAARGASGRRIVVIIGNALAEGVEAALTAAPSLRRGFAFVWIREWSLDAQESRDWLAAAHTVLAQNLGGLDLKRVEARAKAAQDIVSFPDLTLRGLWPFDQHNGFTDQHMTGNREWALRHHDGALAALRETEPDKRRRFDAYRDLAFPEAGRIPAAIETQDRLLDALDAAGDSQLARFIKQHYRETPLFFDSVHPGGQVCRELAAHCARKIGAGEVSLAAPALEETRKWSLPVHPMVARAAGLAWATEATRYPYGFIGRVTWAEWAMKYIEMLG
ncbi:MAG: WcbI family polysaccharide biosynthesis putative acetyltransferase [Thermohalobaculum sp.]